MKKFLFSFIAAVAFLPLAARCPLPFDPAGATMISEPENMMSHAPSMAITDDGEVYIAYYRDSTQKKENPSNTGIEMKLVHFPVGSWEKPEIKRMDFLKCGDKVGGYLQEGRAPYDPVLHVDGNRLAVVFSGVSEGEPAMCIRKMKLKGDKLEDRIRVCDLTYMANGRKETVLMNNTGIMKAYSDLGITDTFTKLFNCGLDKTFVPYNGWLYTVLFTWCCVEGRPIIVRTKDCTHYEAVFWCPEFEFGAAEGTLEIVDDEFYIQCRSARPKNAGKAGTWIGKYSPSGECLVKPWRIGTVESRPAMICRDGTLFSVYNVKPDYCTGLPKGYVYRSHIRISEIDEFSRPRNGWDIASANSIQYYSFAQYNGKAYIVFVEDRQHMADKSRKGNISFCAIDL